ncbi:MAG: FHA domain-containing protein [Minicystis sp.]
MSQDTWAGEREGNGRTHVAPAQRRGPLDPRASFLVAHERLSLLASASSGPRVVVAAVDARARVVESLTIEDRGALVIGRHSQCGLRLHAESISLRHLAVLVRFEDERPVVRIWDLRTGVPFVTEDQQANEAVMADGPLYLALDGYAIWIVPAGVRLPRDPEAAWLALPGRSFLERRAPGPRPAAELPRVPPPMHDSTTLVTRLGPPLLIGEGDEPEIGWGEIRLACGGRKEKRIVSAERLEQGVLIGRYERCGLVFPTTEPISRVHLLLVRIGAEVWAIDTASTNGVRRGDAPFSADALQDSDTLTLADVVTLDWRRTVHPDA